MNFPVNSTILDIVFVIFTILMLTIGYVRGFIVRLYNFLASLVALLLSILLSGPLSDMFHLYATSGVLLLIGSFVNRVFIFGLLFSLFRIVFGILGRFVKPTIKSVISKVPFISKFDRIFGVILSFIETLLITYVVLLISVSPLFNDGKETVKDTMLAKHVLNIAPSITDQVMKITDDFRTINDIIGQGVNYDATSQESIATMLSMLSGLQNFDMLPQPEMNEIITTYLTTLENSEEPIVIDEKTYQKLQLVINKMEDLGIDPKRLYEKIIVSE